MMYTNQQPNSDFSLLSQFSICIQEMSVSNTVRITGYPETSAIVSSHEIGYDRFLTQIYVAVTTIIIHVQMFILQYDLPRSPILIYNHTCSLNYIRMRYIDIKLTLISIFISISRYIAI